MKIYCKASTQHVQTLFKVEGVLERNEELKDSPVVRPAMI